MSGSWDEVSSETMDHMRSMISTVHAAGGTGMSADDYTDAEVLEEIDQNWPGGAAQFQREIEENPNQCYGYGT
jgi:molybdopterin biosynthesis enzyme MoaB